jgi:hypothetical protein
MRYFMFGVMEVSAMEMVGEVARRWKQIVEVNGHSGFRNPPIAYPKVGD